MSTVALCPHPSRANACFLANTFADLRRQPDRSMPGLGVASSQGFEFLDKRLLEVLDLLVDQAPLAAHVKLETLGIPHEQNGRNPTAPSETDRKIHVWIRVGEVHDN